MQKIFFIFAKNKLKKMRIIHFSDFHLDKSNLTQSNNIVYHLENTLKLINQEKNIDLICRRSIQNIQNSFHQSFM